MPLRSSLEMTSNVALRLHDAHNDADFSEQASPSLESAVQAVDLKTPTNSSLNSEEDKIFGQSDRECPKSEPKTPTRPNSPENSSSSCSTESEWLAAAQEADPFVDSPLLRAETRFGPRRLDNRVMAPLPTIAESSRAGSNSRGPIVPPGFGFVNTSVADDDNTFADIYSASPTTSSHFLSQDGLMEALHSPEQRLLNAENHNEALKEALGRAFQERSTFEERAIVAESRIKAYERKVLQQAQELATIKAKYEARLTKAKEEHAAALKQMKDEFEAQLLRVQEEEVNDGFNARRDSSVGEIPTPIVRFNDDGEVRFGNLTCGRWWYQLHGVPRA